MGFFWDFVGYFFVCIFFRGKKISWGVFRGISEDFLRAVRVAFGLGGGYVGMTGGNENCACMGG